MNDRDDIQGETARSQVAEWVAYLKDIGVTEMSKVETGDPLSQHVGDAADRLQKIRTELGECTRCRLHEGRTKLVFGVGDPAA